MTDQLTALRRPPAAANVRVGLANATERDRIYGMRHQVYARELGQHPLNDVERLTDSLDAFNQYLVATAGDDVLGFVSITPPGRGYSVDKYFSRDQLPFTVSSTTFEIRLLTVPADHRGRLIAALLMYAALRWVESRGGTTIIGIGRSDLMPFYAKAGLQPHGLRTSSGAVTYELMSAETKRLRQGLRDRSHMLQKLERRVRWELDCSFTAEEPCYHGGAFFGAIGDSFETLERSREVVNADVLDAWFPPAPGVIAALHEYLPWLLRTSPPTDCAGLVRTIAQARCIPADSILTGAGSSALMFLALREWLSPRSRVLLPDPTYGEYAHIFEHVIGCRVDRLALERSNGFQIHTDALLQRLKAAAYDLVVLVNPNNPTGTLIHRDEMSAFAKAVPSRTRLWIDEAYIDYAGDQSVEHIAAASRNVVVCKSLSKVYALSGARAAYLCGHPTTLRALRRLTPPWSVSLPAQVAAAAALRDADYYTNRYAETDLLRTSLIERLRIDTPTLSVVGSNANWVLCELPADGPDASTVVAHCQRAQVYLRDAGRTSRVLGTHTIRTAVKHEQWNRRIVDVLASKGVSS